MRLIWVRRETEYFLIGDWTTQITLMVLAFLSLCRTPQILGERAAGQVFREDTEPDQQEAREDGVKRQRSQSRARFLAELRAPFFSAASASDRSLGQS
jgi:hypothetical protein